MGHYLSSTKFSTREDESVLFSLLVTNPRRESLTTLEIQHDGNTIRELQSTGYVQSCVLLEQTVTAACTTFKAPGETKAA